MKNPLDVKQNKYKNVKVEYMGIKFDSIKERNYYWLLLDRQSKGEIKNLRRQVKYILIPKFQIGDIKERETSYIADFVYEEKGKEVIVDVKSPITRKDKVYRLKKKLFEYQYKKEIKEA